MGWQLSGLWNKSSTCRESKPDICQFSYAIAFPLRLGIFRPKKWVNADTFMPAPHQQWALLCRKLTWNASLNASMSLQKASSRASLVRFVLLEEVRMERMLSSKLSSGVSVRSVGMLLFAPGANWAASSSILREAINYYKSWSQAYTEIWFCANFFWRGELDLSNFYVQESTCNQCNSDPQKGRNPRWHGTLKSPCPKNFQRS